MPAGRVKALERDPRVVSVSPIPQARLFGEVTPTGIDRIDAEVGITATRGNGVDVAVLDSGSGPHNDLVVTNIDVTGDGESPNDFAGHGTHVAGTVAATFGNNLDVYGVAPGVTLWGVRVFRVNGPTGTDDIQAGLEWLVAQANGGNVIEVANMSLGIACDPPGACPDLADSSDPALVAFHNAVIAAVNAGTTIVVAAGNESTDANNVIPAGYP